MADSTGMTKVFQMTHPTTGEPMSPVVSVGSLYDKNGKKVDNLVSYKVAGTDVPIPEIKDVASELQQQVDAKLDEVDTAVDNMESQVNEFLTNPGLPVHDIRSFPIRTGESISAGDVVNVGAASDGEAETVYKDVVPQDNVENVVLSQGVSDSSLTKMNESLSMVCFIFTTNNLRACLLNNSDGKSNASLSITGGASNIDVVRLADDKACVKYQITSSNSALNVGIINVVSSSQIEYGGSSSVVGGIVSDSKIIALADNLVLLIYSDSGLKCKALPISGTTITTTGTVYSLPSNTGADHISACRLPDEGGNKRVCICFADTGDGNKGKAVIATIDSSNAVTFGDVVTFNSTGETKDISVAYNNGNIALLYSYKNDIGAYFAFAVPIKVVSENSISVGNSLQLHLGQYDTSIVGVANGFIGVWDMYASYFTCNYPEIVVKTRYKFGNAVSYCVSIAKILDNKVIVSYRDGGNSNYGTTTILEVSGNQIAGSFLDNSSDAIALADGTGGQSIPVGFGGYCECPGVTEGQEITSDGVSAFSPIDGWLRISYQQEKSYVFGEFLCNNGGYFSNIDLGFSPSFIVFFGITSQGQNEKPVFAMNYASIQYAYGVSGSTYNIEFSENGFSGKFMGLSRYSFIAWR